jgi:hypothetical protein
MLVCVLSQITACVHAWVLTSTRLYTLLSFFVCLQALGKFFSLLMPQHSWLICPVQATYSPLQGTLRKEGTLLAHASNVPSTLSKLKATQLAGLNTHRAWVDATTFLPLPAIVLGTCAAGDSSVPQHNVLFANSLCISMLGKDLASLRGAALQDVFTDQGLAKRLANCLSTGCQFQDNFKDTFTSDGGSLALVSFPVTDMSDRSPLVGHLLIFLQGDTATNHTAAVLRSIVTADRLAAAGFNTQKMDKDATIRVGLCAAAAAGKSSALPEEEIAPHHAVLIAAYESALSNRLSGKRPIFSLPSATAYGHWLTYFQQCLTSSLAQ